LLGRAITLNDFQRNLPALLDEFSAMASASPSVFTAPLRVWLEHALQLSPHPYRSAADAQEGLKELPASSISPSALAVATAGFLEAFPLRDTELSGHSPVARFEIARPLRPQQIGHVSNRPTTPTLIGDDRDVADGGPEIATTLGTGLATDRTQRRNFVGAWIAIALGLVVLVEGAVITWLALRKPASVMQPAVVIESPVPGDTVMVDGRPVGTTPIQLTVTSTTRAIRLVHAAVAPAVESTGPATPLPTAEDARALAAIEDAGARQRSGGVTVSSPIELKVLEGDRVLGSTADGPIVTSAGTHQLDLMNTALGYRVRQAVTIRAGVLTPLTITPPMGRLSINADPWAQVLIDDKPIGDTPVANVSVSLGEHQVTFRHPQLGERRETVVVRADVPTRVSTSFQR